MLSNSVHSQPFFESHPSDTLCNPPAKYTIPVRCLNIQAVNTDDMTIDGIDNETGYSEVQDLHFFIKDSWDGEADSYGIFRITWSMEYLFLYVEITDDISHESEVEFSWEYDYFDIYVDFDTSWTDSYWIASYPPQPMEVINCHINRGPMGISMSGKVDSSEWLYIQSNNSTNWIVECGMPWTAVLEPGNEPEETLLNRAIGFDFSYGDSDGSPGSPGVIESRANWDTERYWQPNCEYADRMTFGLISSTPMNCGDCPPDNFNEAKVGSKSIYPNPTSDFINISLNGLTTVTIFNSAGIAVMSVKTTGLVDISSLETGLYFISDGEKVHKFIVQ